MNEDLDDDIYDEIVKISGYGNLLMERGKYDDAVVAFEDESRSSGPFPNSPPGIRR